VTLSELVAAALSEDIGSGDATTLGCVRASKGEAHIVAKQDVIVSGQRAAAEVYRSLGERYDWEANYAPVIEDGERACVGDVIARVHGDLRALLIGERVALNFLMRLSGIATNTANHVGATNGGFRVVDTRKTTPLHRALEKAAVRHGGGHNHRFGLDDGVMVKDNHIVAAGGIRQALDAVRAHCHHLMRIEVEVTTLGETREAIEAGADVLLLDNFDDDGLKDVIACARELSPSTVLEASGNMTAERIARIQHLDLDVVSVGGLIHQATWVDLSMRMVHTK